MVGKLLSLDLKDKEVVVSVVHPGFSKFSLRRVIPFLFWSDS